MADFSGLDMAQVKAELIGANIACSQRRLLHGAKWAAEMSKALEMEVDIAKIQQIQAQEAESISKDYDRFTVAHTYFDLKEYDRAANELEHCSSPKAVFLCLYSKYLADEKKKIDNSSDSVGPPETVENEYLKILRSELFRRYTAKELDGFGLYLYGVVLRKLDLLKEARETFVEAVNLEPLHWGTWQELAQLVTDKDMLLSLELPQHWVRHLFMAHVYLELQLTEEALRIYQAFRTISLGHSTYVLAQLAIAYHNVRDTDQAVAVFRELQKIDPYRLENMDIFSNLLYVKELRADLAHLAHRCCDIDKYRVETCCVIGNYYSLRSQHEKAILYFQRALKLNPHYLSAWTLIGHEYMEMKNTSAAIQAYRQAIEVNKRDYRAWYGLGQTYEILKMPSYSLYYYRQAQQLRPNDSRMVMALGESFEKLERLQEAKKCFWKSHSIGDMEGTALLKLAKLYERLMEEDQAAAAYLQYIDTAEREGSQNNDELSQAYKYLANHYLNRRLLDEAYTAAQKCTEFIETREEGKTLLKQIQALRTQGEVHLDDSMGSITGGSQFRGSDHTTLGCISPVNLCFTP